MEIENKRFVLALGALALVLSLLLLKQQGWHFEKGSAVSVMSGTAAAAASRTLPVYCVKTDRPVIALTFDAAWGNEDTQEILDVLAEEEVLVTFFMTGEWVENYPEDVKKIYEAGHELGNHSADHADMTTLSESEQKEEILKAHEAVRELTGYEMQVFRPPYGAYNDTVIETVRSLGYQAVQWDVDSLDWKNYGADSIIQTVCGHSHLGSGSIILCHNGAEYTAEALREMIQKLKSMGYQFVRVSDMVELTNYEIDHEGRQETVSGQ